MLNFFVSVLLIVKENDVSHLKKHPFFFINQKTEEDISIFLHYADTEFETLGKMIQPYIEYIDCEIHKEEICQRLNPRILQMAIRLISTIREVCSEYTLLHAAVVDNLKCWNGKLSGEDNRECSRRETESDRVKQIAEALSEKGLKSLAENGYVTNNLDSCSGLMNFYACQSYVTKRTCGAVAMGAYVEILRNVRPFGYYYLHCEETYALLQFFIHHRKPEEEKERNVAAIFRKRK